MINYSDLSLSEVSEFLLLENKKDELIKLGTDRFGISKSQITNLSKANAVKAIRSALECELALVILADEASLGGGKWYNYKR